MAVPDINAHERRAFFSNAQPFPVQPPGDGDEQSGVMPLRRHIGGTPRSIGAAPQMPPGDAFDALPVVRHGSSPRPAGSS